MPYRNISVFSLMVLFSLVLMVDSQKNLLLLLLTVTLLYVYDQQVIFAAVFRCLFRSLFSSTRIRDTRSSDVYLFFPIHGKTKFVSA